MFSEDLHILNRPTFIVSWFGAAFLALIAYIAGIVLYRLTLHPLAGYPGPFLAKITNLYSVYHAWKGDNHLDFYRCHELYGNVVRCAPSRLSFNSNTALHDIYGYKANCRKSDFYHTFTPKTGPNVVSMIAKDKHTSRRRVLSHAFSDRALKSMEEYMLMHIRTLCSLLNASSKPLDMGDFSSYLTFDIMGELCFGKTFNMLADPGKRQLADLMANAGHASLICGSMLSLVNTGLSNVLFPNIMKDKATYRLFAIAQAKERTQMTADRPDFYHYLTEAKDPDTGEKYTPQELWSESNILIVAGSDTSSTALASMFFYLTRNQAALAKAVKEVRDAFAGQDIEAIKSGLTLNSCQYLRACIDEALRVVPPLPGILPRTVLPGSMNIDGHDIPEGTEVFVSAYVLHHNEKYFSEPFTYRPERWIVDTNDKREKERLELAQSAFAPFSIGPRGCVGKNMAYMEMMLTMARVLFQFDMRKASSLGEGAPELEWGRRRVDEFQVKDIFICKKDGPMVEFSAA